jgi:hypothetical protein
MLPKLPKRHFPKPGAQPEEPVDWRISSRAYVQRYYCDLSWKALLFNFALGLAAWRFYPKLFDASTFWCIVLVFLFTLPIDYLCIKIVPVGEDIRDAHVAKKILRLLEIGLSIFSWFSRHYVFVMVPISVAFHFVHNP